MRNRLKTFVCCLVAMNLVLAPVAHASVMMFSQAGSTETAMDNNFDSEVIGAPDNSVQQLDSHEGGAMNMGCTSGATCKLLCSISVSMIHSGDSLVTGVANSNRWLLDDLSPVRSLFSSRLKRPPRL